MRKSATITINDRVITITEVTVRQMLTVKDSFSSSDMLDAVKGLLPLLTDATPEFLLELAPSELRALYEKVKEVNSDFFTVIPLEKILAGYKDSVMETITSNLLTLSAQSLQQATELPPIATAGDISLPASPPPAKGSKKK